MFPVLLQESLASMGGGVVLLMEMGSPVREVFLGFFVRQSFQHTPAVVIDLQRVRCLEKRELVVRQGGHSVPLIAGSSS